MPLKDVAEQLQFTQERVRGALAANTGIQNVYNFEIVVTQPPENYSVLLYFVDLVVF